MRVPLVYHDGPVFGLDIGSRTAKLVQLRRHGKGLQVIGYAQANFPADTIIEGIISDPKALAEPIKKILQKPTAGHIAASRVATSLPVAKVFIRSLELPAMTEGDLASAIELEAEQYVPVPIADLYIDYEVIETRTDDKGEAHQDVLMVAAPRAIVDSYIQLFDILGLEVNSVEDSLSAITRAMIAAHPTDKPTIVMDFGSRSIDLTIHDKVIRLTGTVPVGGDDLTETLVKKLGVTTEQANEMKYRFGVGPSGLQPKLVDALSPQLSQAVTEIRKVVKYYEERSGAGKKVEKIILSGGSASMPGIDQYLSAHIGIPLIIGQPWTGLDLGRLATVNKKEAPAYTTALGLARVEALHD